MWNLLKNIETREVPSFWGTRIHLIRGWGGAPIFLFLATLNLLLGGFPPHLSCDEKKVTWISC